MTDGIAQAHSKVVQLALAKRSGGQRLFIAPQTAPKLAERVGFYLSTTAILLRFKHIQTNLSYYNILRHVSPDSRRCMCCCWNPICHCFRYHWYHCLTGLSFFASHRSTLIFLLIGAARRRGRSLAPTKVGPVYAMSSRAIPLDTATISQFLPLGA